MHIECLNNKGPLCKLLENSGSYSISYCTSKEEAANDVQVDTACGKEEYQI